MITIYLFMLALLIAAARLCPDTRLGRLILEVFIDGPIHWLAKPDWRIALPYLLVLIGVGLFMLAAPEMAPLAATIDLSLLADILLASSIVFASLGLKSVRHAGRRFPHHIARTLRSVRSRGRRHRALRRPKPPRADDDAPAFA